MNKAYNLLFQYKHYILGFAIFLSLLSVSITITDSSIDLVWKDKPLVAFGLLSLGLLILLLYIQADQYQIKKLSQEIQRRGIAEEPDIDTLLDELTSRQRQVYELIISGKSNKEITAELFIEQSTLKTHINQIYRKLKIKSRRELKNLRK